MVSDSTFATLADISPINRAITDKERSNPRLTAKDRYPLKGRFKATVVNVNQFGVFAELEPGITGLVHSSRLPAHYTKIDAIGVGEEIEVAVTQVNSLTQRMKLNVVSPSVSSMVTSSGMKRLVR
jgi:ribosomal protein S1